MSRLTAFVTAWLQPRKMLGETDSRRQRVLAWMLLSPQFLLVFTLLLVLVVNRHNGARLELYTGLITALLFLLAIAFALNRQGHYKVAVWLTVVYSVLGPWSSLVLDTTIRQGDFVPLVYIVLSVLLSSMFLSVRATVCLAVLQFASVSVFVMVNPLVAMFNWPSLLAFIAFTSVLSVVANFVNRKDLEQIEWQAQQILEWGEHLRELSVRDPLTGLFNRRYLEETLVRELHRAERSQTTLGLIMADVDHFKQFNDTYGHLAGDALLHQLGEVFRTYVRGADMVCRYGGEEFVFVLPEAPLEVTYARAEHMRTQLEHLVVQHENQAITGITLSFGVAIYPIHGTSSTQLLEAADSALYCAKGEGRNRVKTAANTCSPQELDTNAVS